MPTIGDRDRLTNNCAILLKMAGIFNIPYLVTEQYPAGLGRTVDEVATAMGDPSRRVEKTRFSAAVDVVMDELKHWHRPNILICGIEAHVCVLQTVLDLQDTGYQTFICSDAISASQPDQIAPALKRMEKSGAIVTGVLSAMYELMGSSTNLAFKSCLELAKSLA